MTDDFGVIVSESLISNLDSLVKLNIMNYGYEPTLYDNPKKAIFENEPCSSTRLGLRIPKMVEITIDDQNSVQER